jgi:hypothetical protein
MSRHAIVLYEGYHDRQFWSGWLKSRGWENQPPSTEGKILDPLGREVKKGKYALRRGASSAVLEPCDGWRNISKNFKTHLLNARPSRDPGRIDHLIPCFDDDIESRDHAASIRDRFAEVTGNAAPGETSWTYEGIRVDILHIRARSKSFGNRLDGLVADCYSRAHPDRASSIAEWIQSLPSPPPQTDKQTMWTIMAGWYPAKGCDAFLQESIWGDERTRRELENALEEIGATSIVEAMEA